eukprot:scaffold141576_cov22-Prasinocladus_malaysianus.AAC.1
MQQIKIQYYPYRSVSVSTELTINYMRGRHFIEAEHAARSTSKAVVTGIYYVSHVCSNCGTQNRTCSRTLHAVVSAKSADLPPLLVNAQSWQTTLVDHWGTSTVDPVTSPFIKELSLQLRQRHFAGLHARIVLSRLSGRTNPANSWCKSGPC